jgi:hypothetical protein
MTEAGETPRSFAWNDPFDLDGQLSEDEKLVRDSARAFAQRICFPARRLAKRGARKKPDTAFEVRPPSVYRAL